MPDINLRSCLANLKLLFNICIFIFSEQEWICCSQVIYWRLTCVSWLWWFVGEGDDDLGDDDGGHDNLGDDDGGHVFYGHSPTGLLGIMRKEIKPMVSASSTPSP